MYPEPTPTSLWVILAVLVLGAVGVLGYKLRPLLHPTFLEVAGLDPACNLRSAPCVARFSDGAQVRFEIRPREIPTAEPLALEVEATGIRVDGVEVDFVGVDMYMGFNRVGLTEQGPGRYQGQGMIPVCVRQRMTWEARVLIQTPRGLLAAPFRFESLR